MRFERLVPNLEPCRDSTEGKDWTGRIARDPGSEPVRELDIGPFASVGDQTAKASGSNGEESL